MADHCHKTGPRIATADECRDLLTQALQLDPSPLSTMKIFVRLFFKTLRFVIGPVMLLWEFVTRPRGLVRTPAAQEELDQQCRNLVLYQYRTCPFCIRVRQEIRRLSLNLERRNVPKNGLNREDLVRGGGQAKVPCLKISDLAGNSQWLYDSAAIIAYLRSIAAPVSGDDQHPLLITEAA